MSLPASSERGKSRGRQSTASATESAKVKPTDFFHALTPSYEGCVRGIVTAGASGSLTNHSWPGPDVEDHAAYLADIAAGKRGAYLTMALYRPEDVNRYAGRTKANAQWFTGFWLDIEGSAEKYANNPNGGYPNEAAVIAALGEFQRASGLIPSFLVRTGSGGLHAHYITDNPMRKADWEPRAKALVGLAARHGLKIDVDVTTDAARVMRAPGSVHQAHHRTVQAYAIRLESYSLAEIDGLIGFDADRAASVTVHPARNYTDAELAANDEALANAYTPYSMVQAAKACGAMAEAIRDRGARAKYQVWVLALGTAKGSIEGEDFAHEIGRGHEGYDEAETDEKLASLTGGPPGCAAWEGAYGPDGPCSRCEWRGKIKNPAIQLGRIVEVSPPGTSQEAPGEQASVEDCIREFNTHTALARVGSKMAVVDFNTPTATTHGVQYGMGFMDVAALRVKYAGRYAPTKKLGERPRPLADYWLTHPQRRQYDGVVFNPSGKTPPRILNMYQGFGVTPAPGDVSPWLRLLDALVVDKLTRTYVLNWLAWKVQNPGGVPDTVLIFTGGKGTGKNSLFAPLLAIFGAHAMLADDPELIAGRFTWHLMAMVFVVLDEAVFAGDPRQADRIKSRTTARFMTYEQKGMDPVRGVNHCAYVMLTNHAHAWQATADERRAVVVETGDGLRGGFDFWATYHAWADGPGPAALLHHLQQVDVSGFNPRAIPKNDALARQVELTALRDPAVSWWHTCLEEGCVSWRDAGIERREVLHEDRETEIDRNALRRSFQDSAAARGRHVNDWHAVGRKLIVWTERREVRRREAGTPMRKDVLPPLPRLRELFAADTGVKVG